MDRISFNKKVSERIKYIRERILKITIERASEITNVPKHVIESYEKNTTEVSSYYLMVICNEKGIDASMVISLPDEASENDISFREYLEKFK